MADHAVGDRARADPLLSFVDDVDGKRRSGERPADGLPDMARAEEIEPGTRIEGLDQKVHDPAATLARFRPERVADRPGAVGLETLPGIGDRELLEMASPDRAEKAAIAQDEHLGPD